MAQEITSGDLNQTVIFKQPSSLRNNEGGKVTTFTDAITTKAAVRDFDQYRSTQADVTALIGTRRFYIRQASNREAITKDWLISLKGIDHTISAIDNLFMDRNQRFIRFTAKAKTNG